MTARLYGLVLTALAALNALSIVVRIQEGFPVISLTFIMLVAALVVLSGLLARLKLLRVHWLIRSAEWELMELVRRVESGTESRVRKQDEKAEYFSRLAKETANVYAAPAQAGGHRRVGDLPQAPFGGETMELINKQHAEMEKVSKRKARVRLNAALLRELLNGGASGFVGFKSRAVKFTAEERALVMGTVETLSRADPAMVWITATVFRHPSKNVTWTPLKLRGRGALDHLCSF